jgi:hypothetical protein
MSLREETRAKKPRFKAAKEARRRARLDAGQPPPARVIPNKRAKPKKHKETFSDLLRGE